MADNDKEFLLVCPCPQPMSFDWLGGKLEPLVPGLLGFGLAQWPACPCPTAMTFSVANAMYEKLVDGPLWPGGAAVQCPCPAPLGFGASTKASP
ncbi:MAG: hypothetical protein FJ100_18060 [Deltaproteobacteria bacterium]|nr:hypothetical protein [Deltaproteobacteria bacterium]